MSGSKQHIILTEFIQSDLPVTDEIHYPNPLNGLGLKVTVTQEF